MSSPYEELIEFVSSNGIGREEAEHAVRLCALSMAKRGLAGYAAGGAISYFMSMNPATAVPYLVGAAAFGAGSAVMKAPECSQVREAIRYWTTSST